MAAHIGDRGVAVGPLRPTGPVRVGSERRDARALVGAIDAGAEVVVVGWDPFGLVVRPAADVPDAARLANHGAPCPSPQQLAAEREAEAEAVRRGPAWQAFLRDSGGYLGAALPVAVLVGAVGWWWVGVPGVAVGAAAAILVAALMLAWMVLN